ncbi:sugar phosphate isomerase/epimerase family protein [Paenibacillus glycanilyticus]|uniref:Sugar phosphate isomerase n=1 Tax=Paenibacillus glycanilyticus TaxID=126569 RepID=A0ABQ6GH83_9BACL|nr:sugar phosphate isomerase/epimerase family protein [Paenibacillus glycanilyticus]GLX70309.1 sugar phosphate isomerase [Paenibacillus glycanilyticus]
MLKGLTRAGLGPIGDDKAFIEQAARYGFQSVDLDAAGLIHTYGLDGARELLSTNGISVGSCGFPIEWRTTDEAFRDGLAQLEEQAKAAAQLGCTASCTYILPATDVSPGIFTIQAVRRLRESANILNSYGVKLGLEFVGPHHLRTAWKYPFIYSMEDTLAFADAIGAPNVGLLLDAYHWYTNGLGTADIEKLSPEQIVHVHINDAKDIPVEQVLDNDRLYPGEGVIDLPGFLRSLKKIGYTGAVAQEILTPGGAPISSEEALERSKAGFDKVFAAI